MSALFRRCSAALAVLVLASAARAFELDEHFHGVETALPDGPSKLYPDPRLWGFTFWPGLKWPESYGDGTNWLAGNGECQTYVTPLSPVAKALPESERFDPFVIDGDGLHIRAAALTPAQTAAYKA
ncbi:MAG TPA: hypothetical protein VKS60_10725, partial [Stellaceae bacterium]|nr:hypothetical protein [Stellaceae bacterium]